jgi:hypothetical protein
MAAVQILRVLSKDSIVVKLDKTHAVVTVSLDPPIPQDKLPTARLTSIYKPVEAVVQIGPYDPKNARFQHCSLQHADWHAPPKYVRDTWF